MADQSLRDLRARLKIDTTDATAAGKRVKAATTSMAEDLEKSAGKTGRLSGSFLKLHEDIGKLGPVSGELTQRFDAMGLSSDSLKAGLLGVGAAAGLAAVEGVHKLAEQGAELDDQIQASQQVFKGAAAEINAFSQTTARSLGLTRQETLAASNVLGQMFQGAGIGAKDAAALDENLITLSADMAAFAGTSTTDALESLQAAFRGEFDPIEKYGVSLSAAKVEQEALNLGMAKSASQLTSGQKQLATYALLMQQTANIQGQAARESGSLAGQQARLNAVMGDTAATAGQHLEPAVTGLQGAMLGLGDSLGYVGRKFGEANQATGGAGGKLGDFAHEVANVLLPFDSLNRSIDKGAASATHYKDVNIQVIKVGKDFVQVTKDQDAALQKLNDTMLGSFSTDLKYQESQLATKDAIAGVTQAQSDLTDAIRQYGPKSQQAKDAQEALTKAQLGVQESALAEANAAVAVQKAQADLEGASYSSVQSLQAERDEFQRVADQLDPNNPLRARLQGYIDQLNNKIPRNVLTTLTIETVSISGRIGGNQTIEARASGGSVLPNRIYTIGEAGPETLVMGSRGGYVVPNSGSVEVSNMASMRNVEILLRQQNELLAASLYATNTQVKFGVQAYNALSSSV